jgi:two-component system response regulator MtrA
MNARVIVADDEADIRQLVAFTLRRRGHVVIEATDGDAALALISTEHPDLAVLDVMMPGLSGLEVARAASADPATAAIPIILLSAKGQVTEVDEGLASGARAYLVKPFSPRGLADKVADLLATGAISATANAYA